MKVSIQNYYRAYITLSLVCWLFLVFIDSYYIYALSEDPTVAFPRYLSYVLISFFFLFVFLSFKINIGSRKTTNFIEYLWQVFSIGAYTILVSLFIKFFLYITDETPFFSNPILTNLFYHLNIALVAIFLANAFYVFKKMILYQKSKRTDIAWDIFEIFVILSIITNFIEVDVFSATFLLASSPLLILGFLLSFNLKWVAFLNYKQKWQSILLILLITLISSTFLEQIYSQHLNDLLVINLAESTFTLAVFAFILLNCFSGLLVLFFNLPTSSVFEQKFGEIMMFQRLSQSMQIGNKEDEVYELLINSSLNTVVADAGWLEVVDEKGNFTAFINKQVNEIDVFEIKKVLRKNNISIGNDPNYIKNIKALKHSERIADISYKSVLIIPLLSHNTKLGTLVLLKNMGDGFDKEMVDIIYSFVTQASIAIKNFRLISEAVENERIKEEMKIAKDVQKNLLPETLIVHPRLEMTAFYKTATEVGGDYYDIYPISDNKIAIVMGDVSGKGTSAAFNMAQMKGIFQSMIQLNISTDDFMFYANKALSRSLEKNSFITLAIFTIDLENKILEHARAGHCPSLYYSTAENKIAYLNNKGLGLGMIRNDSYRKHIEKESFKYSTGDVLILYTDGIVEAKGPGEEEFGFEKFENLLYLHHHLSAKQLSDRILETLYSFTGTRDLADDHTFLIVKFV
ncbi:MAG: SpoIIE family protein phosphatase [Cytophagaceae bacterium]|nr:SpoIIE family protein phosphatase [Cytophagaceae bacterium]